MAACEWVTACRELVECKVEMHRLLAALVGAYSLTSKLGWLEYWKGHQVQFGRVFRGPEWKEIRMLRIRKDFVAPVPVQPGYYMQN
jgi:hypothetical protein